MKTIYKSFLNEICSFEVPNNAFENKENFNRYQDSLLKLLDANIRDEKLRAFTFIAINSNCSAGEEYILHKFKDYIAISRVLDTFEPIEVDNEIIVLDKYRIYPKQEIEVSINFVYHYKK